MSLFSSNSVSTVSNPLLINSFKCKIRRGFEIPRISLNSLLLLLFVEHNAKIFSLIGLEKAFIIDERSSTKDEISSVLLLPSSNFRDHSLISSLSSLISFLSFLISSRSSFIAVASSSLIGLLVALVLLPTSSGEVCFPMKKFLRK